MFTGKDDFGTGPSQSHEHKDYTLGPRAEHTHALHWLLGQRMIFTAMFPKPSTELIGGRNITILVDWLPTNSLKVIKPASSFN